MTYELRRSSIQRLVANWTGFYRFDDQKDKRWRRCRVKGISPSGANLELLDSTPGESMDGPMSISLKLHSDVQHLIPNTEEGSTQVGVTFPDSVEDIMENIRNFTDHD